MATMGSSNQNFKSNLIHFDLVTAYLFRGMLFVYGAASYFQGGPDKSVLEIYLGNFQKKEGMLKGKVEFTRNN